MIGRLFRRAGQDRGLARCGGRSGRLRNRWRPGLEPLEGRPLLSGTWTPLNNKPPNSPFEMMLMTDGSVLGQELGTNAWFQLTPDRSGSYINGTWSQVASMNKERVYFGSNVLPDGRVFVIGGEYSDPFWLGDINTSEIYNPLNNSWTMTAPYPQSHFGDDSTEVLANGTILCGYLDGPQTYLYNPATDTWSNGGTKLYNDPSAEESWVKLPDGSILSYDIDSSIADGVQEAQRYVPATNSWVAAGTPPVAISDDASYEMGPGLLLPDGRVFVLGATGHTAYYTEATNTWTAGPDIPDGLVTDDAPGCVMPNGDVLFVADTLLYQPPAKIFEFNPTTNTYSDVTPPSNIFDPGVSYADAMLMLPNGQVLVSNGTSQCVVYTPGGAPVAAGVPTITGLTENTDGSFLLAGTGLNGISEGAAYGDDAEMASNYPIVTLTDSSGDVYDARTFNWSSTGVATGSTPESTDFTLPTGLPPGTYAVTVSANGIPSAPFALTTRTTSTDPAPTVVAPAAASPLNATTVDLSVLGADTAGESSLGYTWTTLSAPSSVPLPSFSANGTNSAKDVAVTFAAAGTYTLQVTITNGAGLSTTSSVLVTVNPVLSSLSVPQPIDQVIAGQTTQLSALGLDQFGNLMAQQPALAWTLVSGGGTVSSQGFYTAPAQGTVATVTAQTGGFIGTFSVYVLSAPWLGATDLGESPIGGGSSTDASGTVTDFVTSDGLIDAFASGRFVYQTLTGDGEIVARIASYQGEAHYPAAGVFMCDTFSSQAQLAYSFYYPANPPFPALPWVKLIRSGNTFTSYTSPDGVTWTPDESTTIAMGATVYIGLIVTTSDTPGTTTATFDHVTIASNPTVATTASAVLAGSTAVNLSTLGADAQGEPNLTYTWAATTVPADAASPSFSANGTNAAKASTATLSVAGTYTFTVTIQNAAGLSVTSAATVTATATATTVVVAPANPQVALGSTQQFTATVLDQFGNPMSDPVTWSTSAGTINGSGVLTPPDGLGGLTVTATDALSPLSGQTAVTVIDAPPTIASPATATRPIVTGTSTVLSALGAYAGGEAALTYTWSVTAAPAGAPEPGFSDNGDNSAQNVTVTFAQAGIYSFRVTIADPNAASVTSAVTLTVNQTGTTLTVSPASSQVKIAATQSFAATELDQFGNPMSDPVTWSSTAGTISTSGLLTAPDSAGTLTVTATDPSSLVAGQAAVTVIDAPPTIASPATATPQSVTATSAALSALGDYAGGEAALTYTWSVTSAPAGAPEPVFSDDNDNSAKNATVTFAQAGTYSFQVTITDPDAESVASAVTLTVNQTVTNLTVSPATSQVKIAATQSFAVTELDQFGHAMTGSVVWSTTAGTINPSGQLTAPDTVGALTVTATDPSSHVAGQAAVAVIDAPPAIASPATATPPIVTGTFASLSALGAYAGGEAALTYTWSVTTAPAGTLTPVFSDNGDNSAQNVTVTFAQAGTYLFQVTIADPDGASVTSSLTVFVNQAATVLTISPGSDRVEIGAAQKFAAAVLDQFGNPMTDPVIWSASAGTISATGLLAAPDTIGDLTVTATDPATQVTGHAAVTVIDAPPTIATPATATLPIVTGTSVALSALGAYAGGEAALTYTWSVTTAPTGAPAPMFSDNGDNSSQNVTVTFAQAGTYAFRVTIADPDAASVTSSLTVLVNQAATTVTVSPASDRVQIGTAQQFAAAVLDQFGNPMTDPVNWSTSAGTISATGVLATPEAIGGLTVTATDSTTQRSGHATVTVIDAPPTIASPATATPQSVSGTYAALSVLGAYAGGEAAITYTWAVTTAPAGAPAPVFSDNGDNSAQNVTITFAQAGTYAFEVAVSDPYGATTTAELTVPVNQALTSLTVAQGSAVVPVHSTLQLRAVATDQFGQPMSVPVTWTASGRSATVSSAGLFSSGTQLTTHTVTAQSGALRGQAIVDVSNHHPVAQRKPVHHPKVTRRHR